MFGIGDLQNVVNWHAMVGWIFAERWAAKIAADLYFIWVSQYVNTFKQYASAVSNAPCI
jgi:hypothetical protein